MDTQDQIGIVRPNLLLASAFCFEAAAFPRVRLDREISTDSLTGVLNRAGLHDRIGVELGRAARTGAPVISPSSTSTTSSGSTTSGATLRGIGCWWSSQGRCSRTCVCDQRSSWLTGWTRYRSDYATHTVPTTNLDAMATR